MPVDGTVTGWGCDVLAWLYGRDPSGAGLTASGDLTGLRLPEWFPFPDPQPSDSAPETLDLESSRQPSSTRSRLRRARAMSAMPTR